MAEEKENIPKLRRRAAKLAWDETVSALFNSPAKIAMAAALTIMPAIISYSVFVYLQRANPSDNFIPILAFAATFPIVFGVGFLVNWVSRVPYAQWGKKERQVDGFVRDSIRGLSLKADMPLWQALRIFAFDTEWAANHNDWEELKREFCQTMYDWDIGARGRRETEFYRLENGYRPLERDFWLKADFGVLDSIEHEASYGSADGETYHEIYICSEPLFAHWPRRSEKQITEKPSPFRHAYDARAPERERWKGQLQRMTRNEDAPKGE